MDLTKYQCHRYELRGPKRGANQLSLDESGRTCISWDSTCLDTTVWMWDLIQGEDPDVFRFAITC